MRRRPTVRIVRRRISRPALVSLLATLSVSGVLLILWLSLRGEKQVPAVVRTLADTELTWKCEAGHYFSASAQAGMRECTRCGKRSTVVTDFECPNHGKTEVEALFELNAEGRLAIAKFRAPGGDWVTAGEPLRCSKCGAVMIRKKEDPLEKVIKSKRKGG